MFLVYVAFTILGFAVMAFVADKWGNLVYTKTLTIANKVKNFLNN